MRFVLVYRGIDDIANLKIMRELLILIRKEDFGAIRIGPFDDRKVAEQGVFVEGAKGNLERVQREMDKRLAKANIPALPERVPVMEPDLLGEIRRA